VTEVHFLYFLILVAGCIANTLEDYESLSVEDFE